MQVTGAKSVGWYGLVKFSPPHFGHLPVQVNVKGMLWLLDGPARNQIIPQTMTTAKTTMNTSAMLLDRQRRSASCQFSPCVQPRRSYQRPALSHGGPSEV